ncbi:hypothetical protein VNO78_29055 [Psophocarpus tetragonolobus]|uniref:Uncharacterized protein n=1 Tax=Psophocarpus tetragonolobus TaxID=3891 RepID=A0AAN9RUE6_PSOTE
MPNGSLDTHLFGEKRTLAWDARRTYEDGDFHVPLMNWVWQLYVEGRVMDAVDEMNKEFDVDQMKSLLIVGLWCTNPNDKERPKAAQVIKVLRLEGPLPELPLDLHDRPPISIETHKHAEPTYDSLQPPLTNSFTSVGR